MGCFLKNPREILDIGPRIYNMLLNKRGQAVLAAKHKLLTVKLAEEEGATTPMGTVAPSVTSAENERSFVAMTSGYSMAIVP